MAPCWRLRRIRSITFALVNAASSIRGGGTFPRPRLHTIRRGSTIEKVQNAVRGTVRRDGLFRRFFGRTARNDETGTVGGTVRLATPRSSSPSRRERSTSGEPRHPHFGGRPEGSQSRRCGRGRAPAPSCVRFPSADSSAHQESLEGGDASRLRASLPEAVRGKASTKAKATGIL